MTRDPEKLCSLYNGDRKENNPQLTDTLIGALPILPPGEEQMDRPYNSNDSRVFQSQLWRWFRNRQYSIKYYV